MRKFRMPSLVMAGFAVAAFVGAGCKSGNTDPVAKASLYTRLGGKPAITKVVDEFVPIAASNPAVNFTRKGHPNQWEPTDANIAKLKTGLVTFIAKATGGPDEYKGRSMPEAHKSMEITNQEFNALASDLKKALDKVGVPPDLQGELLQVVETTRNDIVGK